MNKKYLTLTIFNTFVEHKYKYNFFLINLKLKTIAKKMLCLSAEFANKAGQKVQGQDGNTETAQISQYTVLLDL